MSNPHVVAEFSYVDPAKQRGTRATPLSSRVPPINPELFTDMPHNLGDEPAPARKKVVLPTKKANKWLTSGSLAIAIIAFSIYFYATLYNTTEEICKLDRTGWAKTIKVEQAERVPKEGWTLPEDSELDYYEEKYSHTENTITHYEDVCKQVQKEVPVQKYVKTNTKCYEDGRCESVDVYETVMAKQWQQVCEQRPVKQKVAVYKPYYHYWTYKWIPLTLKNEGKNLENQHGHCLLKTKLTKC